MSKEIQNRKKKALLIRIYCDFGPVRLLTAGLREQTRENEVALVHDINSNINDHGVVFLEFIPFTVTIHCGQQWIVNRKANTFFFIWRLRLKPPPTAREGYMAQLVFLFVSASLFSAGTTLIQILMIRAFRFPCIHTFHRHDSLRTALQAYTFSCDV